MAQQREIYAKGEGPGFQQVWLARENMPEVTKRPRASSLQKAVAFWDSFRAKNPAPTVRRPQPANPAAAQVEELRRRNAALETQLSDMRWVDVERLELLAENARLRHYILQRSKVQLTIVSKRK